MCKTYIKKLEYYVVTHKERDFRDDCTEFV